ncbi:MAG: peptide deformylase [bacterium]|nr:peptide deformylase [bacterium]
MVRPIIQIGNPILKADNTHIDHFNSDKVLQVIQDLKDTMYETGLIGIAAPQIGENFHLFITEPRETPVKPKEQSDILRIYINPVIVRYSEEQAIIYEGCGSVVNADIFGPVKRPKEVTVEAFDETGKKFKFTADGILGRVIQHEYDHLQGIEFIEKADDYKKLLNTEFFIQRIKTSKEQIEASVITKQEIQF